MARAVVESMRFSIQPATEHAEVLVPVIMNSSSQSVVCAVDAKTVTAMEVSAVDAQKHSTSAVCAVADPDETYVPKARTRHTELAARVWLVRVTPPVVGVVVSLIVVAVVRAPE